MCYEKLEDVNKDNVEQWLLSCVCELGFQHKTDMYIADAVKKQNREEDCGEDENEGGHSSGFVNHNMAPQYACIARLCVSERVKYSYIAAVSKICTTVRSSLGSSQNMLTLHTYFCK